MKNKTAPLLIFIGFFMSSCDRSVLIDVEELDHRRKYRMKNRELDYIIKVGNAKDKAELRLLIRTTDSILSNP